MSPQTFSHQLQHYQPPESPNLTTMLSTMMIQTLNGTGSVPSSLVSSLRQDTNLQQATDHSVFSLLTIRNALIISCYSLIILVSLTGNLLVCRVAFGTRDMRTTTNLLIASLACSDIVMTGK